MDWKPDNILIQNDKLKLTDFGSCLRLNEEVDNPENINVIWSSPNMMPFMNKKIKPTRQDDMISICYMCLWLMNINLPWKYIRPECTCKKDLELVYLIIWQLKVYRKVHKIDFNGLDIPERFTNSLIQYIDI